MAEEQTETTVIVGAGHAGGMLATTLAQKKYPGRVLIVGDEPYLPYQRPPLSKDYLAGDIDLDKLYLKPQETYDKAGIDLTLDTRVEKIDRDSKSLKLANGADLAYDKLVLATGIQMRVLKAPGSDLNGIHYLRTISDVQKLRPELIEGHKLVIVGGGYIGLEVAAIAVKRGVDVTVLEAMDRVMERVTGPDVSAYFEKRHRDAGVDLRTGAKVAGFEDNGSGHVSAVTTESGEKFEATTVLVSIGIMPETALAEAAGLDCDDGIVVDEFTRTSDPDIFAIGDCTRHKNLFYSDAKRLEAVSNAVDQARATASVLCGEDKAYDAVPWFWSNQYDIRMQMVGLSDGHDDSVMRGLPDDDSFAIFYLKNGVVISVDAVNDPKSFMAGKKLVAARATPDKNQLSDTSVDLKTLT
ncbi:MAG: pyridine nucleotide-disulfide oxidoreductase [Salinisphaeraceae bacterium]|nr:pyridine nucleotide-disulfide oxidoreductase [Salinisphaeraceae bacterium]